MAVHPFPSLRQVIDVCRSRESAANNDDLLPRVHLSGPPVVATAAAPHHQDHSTACPQCGYPRHTGKRCPAQGSLCNKCGQLGHFARVCTNTKSMSTGHPASKSAPRTRQVLVLDVSSPDLQWAPTVVVELGNAYCPDVYGTCVATPDTGAEANILGVNMLTSLGIPPEQMCPPVMTSILAANGSTLTCAGTLVFAISYSGNYSTTEVLVCQDHQGMLLSWFTCRDLATIPSRCPEAIPRVAPVVASLPRDNPSPADRAKVCEQLLINTINAIDLPDDAQNGEQQHSDDPLIKGLQRAASNDRQYAELLQLVETGFPASSTTVSPNLRHYWKLRAELSSEDGLVLFNSRIVIPQGERLNVLRHLHASHQGIVRTKQRARQTVYCLA